jgi:hypothetical protein
VRRRLVEAVAVGELGDVAEVHHRDPVGDVPDDREVVRDEQVGEVEVLLEVLEEVDDLGLDGHVERRDRLVEHDQVRLEREGPGDPDALPLAAGELVRVAVAVLGLQPDGGQQVPTRARAASFEVPWMMSGSAIVSRTGMRGLSDANGSWKTICMLRRSSRSAAGSRP